MDTSLIGYHGTDSELVSSIQNHNFRPSTEEDEWMGHGIYFFSKGVGCPVENASEWARNQAYSPIEPKYSNFAVLQANVKCERLLDIRNDKALTVYNEVRNDLIQQYKKFFRTCHNVNKSDCKMWNLISEHLNLEVVVQNLYIKDCHQRRLKIRSNVPNTTVMCVRKTEFIEKESIIVKTSGVT